MLTRDDNEWKVIKQDSLYLLLEGDRAVYGPFKTEGHAYDYRDSLVTNRGKKNAEG